MSNLKENPIYRNIQFDPRIWGVSYKSLLAAMGILLVGIMLFKSILGLVGGMAAGLASTAGYYSYAFWNDNRDKIESEGRKTPIKRVVASYVIGSQTIKIK
jgi:hypothetical protein